jgi:hypothetical protein
MRGYFLCTEPPLFRTYIPFFYIRKEIYTRLSFSSKAKSLMFCILCIKETIRLACISCPSSWEDSWTVKGVDVYGSYKSNLM